MALAESQALYDTLSSVEKGMDSGHAPSRIDPSQVALLVNGTTRNGFAENRPGWSRIALTGDSLNLGLFQGASPYYSPEGFSYIVASIGGQIVRIDPLRRIVTNLSNPSGLATPPEATSNPSNLPKTWFCQAETYLAIQDNSSKPLVYDGSVLRRMRPVDFGGDDFPVGNAMEYNNGRLWVALPDRRTFSGGDLAYSVTGTVADVLTSTQNKFLTGGAFVLPSSAGRITALRSLAIQDSVLGQGPLVVFGEFGAGTVNAPFNVDEWQTTSSPIQTVGLIAPGPTSQESCITINGDIWYRAADGVRTFMIARRDHNTWVNTPVSNEMSDILERDDPYLLDRASAVDFNNRHLETVSPYRVVDGETNPIGVAWRGLSVLDFKPITNMFDRSQPAWDGLWTGLNILQVLTLRVQDVMRCYLLVINDSFGIELWELSAANRFDNTLDPIQWIVETRAFGFSDQAETLKEFTRTETWIENLTGGLSYTIRYRPDAYQSWLDLDSGTLGARSGLCAVGCAIPVPSLPQYRARILSSGPDATAECCVNKLFRYGYEFQFRLEFQGAASLRRFRVAAHIAQENVVGGCLPDEVTSS